MNPLVIAVDPGVTGGCVVGVDAPAEVNGPIGKIPFVDDLGVKKSLELRVDLGSSVIAIEDQRGTGRMTDFAFGVHFGRILAAYEAAGLSYNLVPPQRWQHGLGVRGMEYGARKARLRELAAEKFPTIKVTNWNADALLLWAWAKDNLAK